MEVRIFIGTPVHYIRSECNTLSRIPHKGKEYFGCYLDNEVSISHVEALGLKIAKELGIDPIKVIVFPELFYS